MRKVIWSEYVQNGSEEIIGKSSYSRKPKWELKEQGEALFHQWGRDTHSDEDGSFSTAIIELEDGTVKNIKAEQVRFISGEIEDDQEVVIPEPVVDNEIIEKTIEFSKIPNAIKRGISVYPSIAECLEFKQELMRKKAKGAK